MWSIRAQVAGLAQIISMPAQSEPIAYTCNFVESSNPFHWWRDIDQLVIDIDAQSVELRVAKTMLTKEPVHWVFQNRKSFIGEDAFAVKDGGNLTVGAGIYGSAAHSFFLNAGGELTWAFVNGSEPTWFRWNCRN